MTTRALRGHYVVRVVDLDPIAVAAPDPPLRFRIEVLEPIDAKGRFHARVLRYETFRIQPTFPQKRGKPVLGVADEEVLVVDPGYAWDELSGNTPEDAVQAAVGKLKDALGL